MLLQSHPLLPCTHLPSNIINCLPLDDITGNKRQQQDNKKSELKSTSFISDFITPLLMDGDLCTILTLHVPSPLLFFPVHNLSSYLFLYRYLWTPDGNVSLNKYYSYSKKAWVNFNEVLFVGVKCWCLHAHVYDIMKFRWTGCSVHKSHSASKKWCRLGERLGGWQLE